MKNPLHVVWLFLFSILIFFLIGCSSGGSSDNGESARAAIMAAVPESYDFGTVTVDNFPAPLEVKIKNSGSLALEVTEISLFDRDNFDLFLDRKSVV